MIIYSELDIFSLIYSYQNSYNIHLYILSIYLIIICRYYNLHLQSYNIYFTVKQQHYLIYNRFVLLWLDVSD